MLRTHLSAYALNSAVAVLALRTSPPTSARIFKFKELQGEQRVAIMDEVAFVLHISVDGVRQIPADLVQL
jgi:hypothetical protein